MNNKLQKIVAPVIDNTMVARRAAELRKATPTKHFYDGYDYVTKARQQLEDEAAEGRLAKVMPNDQLDAEHGAALAKGLESQIVHTAARDALPARAYWQM